MNRHSLFLRWEKDNTVTGKKSSFSGLLHWGSVCATENQGISKCFLGHPQNHFLQTLPFWPTGYALYSQFTQQIPKHFVFSLKGWEAPAVWISKSDWVSWKEKGQNCTCLLKPSKSMEWSRFLDFDKHFNCWNKYWVNISQVKMQDCRKRRNSFELVLWLSSV